MNDISRPEGQMTAGEPGTYSEDGDVWPRDDDFGPVLHMVAGRDTDLLRASIQVQQADPHDASPVYDARVLVRLPGGGFEQIHCATVTEALVCAWAARLGIEERFGLSILLGAGCWSVKEDRL